MTQTTLEQMVVSECWLAERDAAELVDLLRHSFTLEGAHRWLTHRDLSLGDVPLDMLALGGEQAKLVFREARSLCAAT